MIPILEHRPTTAILFDKGLRLPILCQTCHKRIDLDDADHSCCLWTDMTHWSWPGRPWMYLAMTDQIRGMLTTATILLESPSQFVWWVDSHMAVCVPCFSSFLEQVEDECKETSYWPLVLAIRKKHEPDDFRYVQSPGTREAVVDTPSLLGQQGWPDQLES